MTVLLLIALLAAAALAAYFAVRASRLEAESGQKDAERDRALAECEQLSARLVALPDLQQRLAGSAARLEEIEAERDRLLGKDGERAEKATEHMTKLRSDLDSIKVELPKILDHSSKAASGAERVETSMSVWTRRIANPQSRGAFGELAVENQLKSLGLEPGRDYMRQVAGEDGRLRPDFVVRLGDASVVIDAKFALDDELAGIDEAIDADDPERLLGYGRKLRARAEDLAKRDYAKVADRGKAIVLLYVPVEGAYEALRVLPNFSIEKFSQRHRVYLVTPSQLGLALGFVAEVAHDARRSEETEKVATTLLDAAEDMANMVDQLDQHGKHLQTAFTSYDKLVGMTGTRGNLWRRMSTVFEFARRSPESDGEVRQISPPRDDAGEIAERWRAAAGE
ncbi:MAG: DNA recombination protein RmuC [Solirubrobacterales bacterium]|nr:DNA recombination protein RmuC [Solirubrobacterales bacterium]